MLVILEDFQLMITAISSDSLQYYNWQDIMLRNAVRQSYRLEVSGGQDNNTFYVAGGLNSTDGILQSTGMKSYDQLEILRIG